jgi:hypothetical protein
MGKLSDGSFILVALVAVLAATAMFITGLFILMLYLLPYAVELYRKIVE